MSGCFDGALNHIVLGRDRAPIITPIIGGTGGQDGPCETAQLSGSRIVHVAVETDGSVWFAERLPSSKYRVRQVTWTVPAERVAGLDCQVRTIATLPARGIADIALDGQGNLLVSSGGLHRISPDGAVSTLLSGETLAFAFADGSAYLIERDGESLTIAISKIDAAGRSSTLWVGVEGESGGGVLSLQDIALAAASDGSLYAWNGRHDRIVRIRADGSASIVYDVTDDLGGPNVYIDGTPYIGANGDLWVNTWNSATDSTEIRRLTFPDE